MLKNRRYIPLRPDRTSRNYGKQIPSQEPGKAHLLCNFARKIGFKLCTRSDLDISQSKTINKPKNGCYKVWLFVLFLGFRRPGFGWDRFRRG